MPQTAKRSLGVVLLLFAAGSLVALAVKDRGGAGGGTARGVMAARQSDRSNPSDQSDKPAPNANRHLVVYYFHGNFRCPTCNTIERLSRETIEKEFSQDLRAGRVMFQAVNTDEPDNRHFVQDYLLFAQSLVLVEYVDDKQTRWENRKRIWELVHDEPAFRKYVRDGVRAFLKGEQS